MTAFDIVDINGVDYKSIALRAELWRNMSAVGNWEVLLRNIGGIHNNTFDVQYTFQLTVAGNVLMTGLVDGPAVLLKGRDLESIWDEYVILKGVDCAQDLLFHNDFEYDYPSPTQEFKTVLNNVINVQLKPPLSPPPLGTNITYLTPAFATPVVGSVEFRSGASFLTQVQELARRAAYIFYVDDNYLIESGPPGNVPGFNPSPNLFRSIAGDATNNIIDIVDFQTRDGDKHYNYVKLTGKNPMFDGYTECNAVSWTSAPNPPTYPIYDAFTPLMVGTYSQVACNHNPVDTLLWHTLACPVFNYTSWDFSSGEIGIWARYDNNAGAPGTPGAGNYPNTMQVVCRLYDNAGIFAEYIGDSTTIYEDNWGYCTFPLGEKNVRIAMAYVNDTWCVNLGPEFDWTNVVRMSFYNLPSTGMPYYPSHFYIDGISLPIPVISVMEDVAAQNTYRRRPYIDNWPHVRTQLAMDGCAQQVLDQSRSTNIKQLKFVTPGTATLRYAGQSITVDIPALGINNDAYYITQLHHVIEPGHDVSGGYGFDWVTEVECLPVSGTAYDMSRLRIGPMYSSAQSVLRVGTGAGVR